MATYKALQNRPLSLTSSHLECDICGSADIVDTSEGYVCRECGIVLEIQKLQYNRPYNEDLIQHSKGTGKTQIGNSRERGVSPISEKLNRLNRQNSIIPNEQAIIEKADLEISRIFSELNLSEFESLKKMVLNKFKEIRPKLRRGVKYRNTNKLVSIIIYFCLKLRNISVNAVELINASKITKKEFNDFCLQVRKFLPEYLERNRQEYILNRVFEISQHFDLGMDFFHLARKILKKLWQGIKNTTDDALAGLVCSISLLCSQNEEVTVSAICNRLGIRMSTIQAQVKKKIINKFRVEGFISLIKSTDLLVQIMDKLGLLNEESLRPQEEEQESSDIVEIDVGNASRVFNAIDNVNYYYSYFVIKGQDNTVVFINLAIYLFDESFKKPEKAQGEAFLDFLLYRYPLPTGPPIGKA
jgi:transcription initiation factor TFIIIB Brf1 subunit/transcription initiation factor TFIIB